MKRNSYYYTCPTCGANLDPGEKCSDCLEENEKISVDTCIHSDDEKQTTPNDD